MLGDLGGRNRNRKWRDLGSNVDRVVCKYNCIKKPVFVHVPIRKQLKFDLHRRPLYNFFIEIDFICNVLLIFSV